MALLLLATGSAHAQYQCDWRSGTGRTQYYDMCGHRADSPASLTSCTACGDVWHIYDNNNREDRETYRTFKAPAGCKLRVTLNSSSFANNGNNYDHMYVKESTAGTTGTNTDNPACNWYQGHTTPSSYTTTNEGSYVTLYFRNQSTQDSRFDITIECICCPQPTNVTVSSVTENSAQVSWTGSANASSYNLRYRFVKFGYDFESAEAWAVDDFPPCTTYDGDGGSTYTIQNNTFTNQGYTGSFIAFQNGINNATAHGGNAFGACFNAVTGSNPNNDFFILPEINIDNGDRLTFWAKSFNDSYGLEQFKVGVYASNGTFSSYLAGNATTSVDAPVAWTEFSYDLSAYAGQTIRLAINCVSNDVFAFFIDDISVSSDWIYVNNVTSPHTLTGLYSESTHEVQVQSDCGGGSESGWSPSETFTTLPCPEPTNVTVTDITNNTATVSWNGSGNSYTVRYRTAGFVVPTSFEQVGNNKTATETLAEYSFNTSAYSGLGCIAIRHYNVTDQFYLNVDDVNLTEAGGTNILSENFEGGVIPTNWINYDADADGYVWHIRENANDNNGNPVGNGSYSITSASYMGGGVGALTPDNWLIIPNVELGGTFSFYARGQDPSWPAEVFGVFVSTKGLPPGEWIVVTGITETSLDLSGLASGTEYEVQVQANCNGVIPSSWTDPENFTTCNLDATIEISN